MNGSQTTPQRRRAATLSQQTQLQHEDDVDARCQAGLLLAGDMIDEANSGAGRPLAPALPDALRSLKL